MKALVAALPLALGVAGLVAAPASSALSSAPMSSQLGHIHETIHSPVAAPDESFAQAPVVILGNYLPPDGHVHPTLERRLEVGLRWAQEHPDAPVVLTGGDNEQGHNEARTMRAWLIERGMDAERILIEPDSWSTISNAHNTHALLGPQDRLVLVTSESHLHRAVVNFAATFGEDTQIAGLAAEDVWPVERSRVEELSSISRDLAGLWLLPDAVLDGTSSI
ncbi:YdcF family protein [Corynebacterium yudongzhengii]|nr:YdcF family protein [Corynebacterium yudongzhengii]